MSANQMDPMRNEVLSPYTQDRRKKIIINTIKIKANEVCMNYKY